MGCGPGVCTLAESFTTTISLSEQTGSVVSTVNTAQTLNQISPSITSTLSAVVSGTETGSRISTIVVSTGGGGLSGGQIGGISVGAVVGFLLLVAAGWLIVRHLVRISRFMDKFDSSHSSKPATKEGGDTMTGAAETTVDSGSVGAGQVLTELSPQERPQLLEEWGRHGSRGPELTGSYEAHGISELDSASVDRAQRQPG